jgi:Zn-dependent peptidase ImmA (M78 family)
MPKMNIYFMSYESVNGIKHLLVTVAKENEVVYNNFKKTSIQEYGDVDVDKAVEGFCVAGDDDYLIYISKSTREHEDDILKHELGHVIENLMQRLIDSGKISCVKNQDGDCDLSKPFLVHEYNG